jgi:hypothetical protein
MANAANSTRVDQSRVRLSQPSTCPEDLEERLSRAEAHNTQLLEVIASLNRHREEQDDIIRDLAHTLAAIKLLHGLLPICAGCKKIRDDNGTWNYIETYISKHSEAQFTHGLCPTCEHDLYPELHRNK